VKLWLQECLMDVTLTTLLDIRSTTILWATSLELCRSRRNGRILTVTWVNLCRTRGWTSPNMGWTDHLLDACYMFSFLLLAVLPVWLMIDFNGSVLVLLELETVTRSYQICLWYKKAECNITLYVQRMCWQDTKAVYKTAKTGALVTLYLFTP